MNVSAAIKETSRPLGCSKRIVYSLRTQQGALKCPPKKKLKREGYQKYISTLVYDMQVQTLIRRKVHCSLLSNIPPTLSRILTSVNMDNDVPNFKRTTPYKVC
ncbi:hypothetical protein Trydic_g18083 [Trypoxylus dichotomus]